MKARILFTTLSLLLSGCLTTLPTVSATVVNTPQIHQYERARFAEAFVRHNFDPYRLSPQIDALKQPIEDK